MILSMLAGCAALALVFLVWPESGATAGHLTAVVLFPILFAVLLRKK